MVSRSIKVNLRLSHSDPTQFISYAILALRISGAEIGAKVKNSLRVGVL